MCFFYIKTLKYVFFLNLKYVPFANQNANEISCWDMVEYST